MAEFTKSVNNSECEDKPACDMEPAGWPEGFWETHGALDDDTFVEPDELDPSFDAPRKEL